MKRMNGIRLIKFIQQTLTPHPCMKLKTKRPSKRKINNKNENFLMKFLKDPQSNSDKVLEKALKLKILQK